MQVIKENKGYDVIGYCPNCSSKLKINTFDVKYKFFIGHYINCPVCGNKASVSIEILKKLGYKVD